MRSIYFEEHETRLRHIKDSFENMKVLKNSLADSRREYRIFADSINLDFFVIDDCIQQYEKHLLVSCYTFAEQATKNLIYFLVGKDSHENFYINNFINNKLPVDRFSPGAKTTEIEKILKELNPEFQFIIQNHENFEKYNEMVISRHKYAHANNYVFDFNQFEEVIPVLEYLDFEFTLLSMGNGEREAFKRNIDEIKTLATKVYNHMKNKNLKDVDCRYPKINDLVESCKKMNDNHMDKINKLSLFEDYKNEIIKIISIEYENILDLDEQKKIELLDYIKNLYGFCI